MTDTITPPPGDYDRDKKESFLVANRSVAIFAAGLAIASNWVWAPALFISAKEAYLDGMWGLLWFTVPNMLTLIIFGLFASDLTSRVPRGFTLPSYMKERHGKPVHRLYLFQMGFLAVAAFAVQLLAGAAFFEVVADIDFFASTVALAIFAISYSMLGGLRASIGMNWMSMLSIIFIGGALVLWVVAESGGASTVADGIRLGGVSDKSMLMVMLGFGIPVTIGLLSGPWGDQSFWQRSWAIEDRTGDGSNVKKAFIIAAFAFVTVPIIMGTLGFVAAGTGIPIINAGNVNIETVQAIMPDWTVIPFAVIIVAGLLSTLDSQAVSWSSLWGHDINNARGGDVSKSVPMARMSMVLLGALALLIANYPAMTISGLFIIYGTVRASTFWPSILTLKRDHIDSRWMAWGIGLAMLVGIPLTWFGNTQGVWYFVLTASLSVWALSGILTYIGVRKAAASA